jgi:hypothetical protein
MKNGRGRVRPTSANAAGEHLRSRRTNHIADERMLSLNTPGRRSTWQHDTRNLKEVRRHVNTGGEGEESERGNGEHRLLSWASTSEWSRKQPSPGKRPLPYPPPRSEASLEAPSHAPNPRAQRYTTAKFEICSNLLVSELRRRLCRAHSMAPACHSPSPPYA